MFLLTLLLSASAATAPALAADVSPWDGDSHTQARLIAAPANPASPSLGAGVELQLKPGWMTYWRYPGDAGIPPRFDFGQSDNVKSVQVSWPAPERIDKDGVVSIGYHEGVIFPLEVTRADPSKPAHLRLKLDYGVCEKLCVPAEANVDLALPSPGTTQETRLAVISARVPKPAALGAGDDLAIKSVRREDGGANGRVVVDVAAPDDAIVDLFAEGPTADWALPLPVPVKDAPPGIHRFTFDLDGAPPGAAYRPLALKLTAVAGVEAIEVVTGLD